MSSAPYGVRLLIGAATIAVEETVRLPKTILMYPVTFVSQAAHVVMRFQQSLAELVNKGDNTLESIFPPKDEKPGWATFDEDSPDAETGQPTTAGDADRLTEGRFALYSSGDAPAAKARRAAKKPPTKAPGRSGGRSEAGAAARSAARVPEPMVADLDYATLTLAQLRARLPSLTVDDLESLLAYEQATKARAPFQTLLANRITRATAK
jgi:hypothetical protein